MWFFLRAPLPAPLARQRLKSNLAALVLLTFARSVFTPYLALRGLMVSVAGSAFHNPNTIVWWLETLATAVLTYNIAEAAYHVQHPSPAPPTPAGMRLVPVLKSSPLTRSYAPAPDLGASANAAPSGINYTPTRTATQSPLAQSLYKSIGRDSPRASPLAASTTAGILNLQQPATPSHTGLFFDNNTPASPSKVARPGSVSGTPTKPTPRANYTVVDREEREWVDNVWKGVKGKSHKLGL